MFDKIITVRGVRKDKNDYKIKKDILTFTQNSTSGYFLKKGDIVIVDHYFLGLKYKTQEIYVYYATNSLYI